jgi:hypothetical protein
MFVCGWLLGFEIRQLFTRGPIDPRETRPRALVALLGMLVLVLLALLEEYRSLQITYDPMLTSTLYQASGLKGVLRYILQQPRVWNDSPLVVAGYVLATMLLAAVAARSREERAAETLLYGLAIGVLISVLMMLAQVAGIHPSISFNRSAFWVMTGRFGASFSDPNALGIMAALLVPLLWHAPARSMPGVFRFASIALAVSALWSGSRTFWIGMALWLLWAALFAGGYGSAGRRRLARWVFGLACFATGVVALPQTNDWLAAKDFLPARSAWCSRSICVTVHRCLPAEWFSAESRFRSGAKLPYSGSVSAVSSKSKTMLQSSSASSSMVGEITPITFIFSSFQREACSESR